MRIVTGMALNACLAVRAGMPFIGGCLMAGAAQICIGRHGHQGIRVTGLEWAVAGFAGNALMGIGAALGIKSCCMARQASKI